MTKAMMQKWQRDWFVKELDRDYDPLIQAAQLKIRSLEAEAVEIAEKNLADEIGATPIIKELEEAIENVKNKMSKAARFFRTSKVAKKKDVNYKFREKEFNLDGYGANRIMPDDCWEQIREWAFRSLVSIKEIAKGSTITKEDIWSKRPGTGIPSHLMDTVIGKVALRDIPSNTLLSWEDFSD